MTEQLLERDVLEGLAAQVRGDVLRPADKGYDEARSVWNGLIDRRPAAIVRCSGAADVVDAVTLARESGLVLSIKGGGHNVAGTAVNDGGLVVDLSRMNGVRVDPATGTVRVGGGATLGDVDRETQVFGLAVPSGVVSETGVAGLTLHGGMGHLRRKHGLSIDNLVSVDLVTADGELRRASETENEDLFWAVRGAGSNFGAVTSFEFRAHPVGPEVMVCACMYAAEDAMRVLPAWSDYTAETPDDVSSMVIFWSVPAHDPFPEELHERPVAIIAAVYAGDVATGERVVAPLRRLAEPLLDLSGPWPWTGLQSAFDADFPAGRRYYWKSRSLRELSDAAIAEIGERAFRRPTPYSTLVLWHLGGAIRRVGDTETAYAGRDAAFLVTAEATWIDPRQDDEAIEWSRETWAAMEPFTTGGLYLNFPGVGEDQDALARAGYGPNYERLAALKARYDPSNVFSMNVNITPAA